MGQRKKRFVALVCAVSVIALSGCGDDLTQQVCIPGVEELAQPIGGYHTGPQDDQPGVPHPPPDRTPGGMNSCNPVPDDCPKSHPLPQRL